MAEMHDIKANSGPYLPYGIKANRCQYLILQSMVASVVLVKFCVCDSQCYVRANTLDLSHISFNAF